MYLVLEIVNMSKIQPHEDKAPLHALLPEAAPQGMRGGPRHASAKRYLLPLLLVGLALIINVLAVYAPEETEGMAEFNQVVSEMSVDELVDAAVNLAARGDLRYAEGYQYFDDVDVLAEALVDYREAWRLITRQDYPGGMEDAVIVDSPECRTLHSRLKQRIAQLVKDLEP